MSQAPANAVALLNIKNQLPANLSRLMPAAPGADLYSGVSGGFPILSIKGSKWTMVESGERTPITIPGTNDSAPSIKVVLLKANPAVSKTFYLGKFQEGSDAPPDCFSSDGVTPSPESTKPQCTTCAACPQNQWGSKISETSGKKVKACADVRRVAVLPSEDLDHPPILLRVPAASLSGLANYGRMLNKAGVPYTAVVTKLAFDPTAAFPLVTFTFDRVLDAEEIDIVAERLDDPMVEDVIDGPVFLDEGAPTAQPAAPAPVAAPAPAPVEPPAAAPAEPAPRTRRPRAAAAPAPVEAPAPAPAPVQQAATVTPITQSSGPVVGSDAGDDIEAALAGLGF